MVEGSDMVEKLEFMKSVVVQAGDLALLYFLGVRS